MGDTMATNPPVESKPPRSRWQRRLIWATVAFVLYSIAGFLILPAVIKSQLLKQLPVLTKRSATVEEVQINPYSLALTIRNLALKEPNGDPFAGFAELHVNFELASLFKGAWTFHEISLRQPSAQVTMIADGKFNFSNLLEGQPANSSTKELPAVLVELLNIEGGNITLTDLTRAKPFQLKVAPIQVQLNQLATRKDARSPYSFTASDDAGQTFSWSGAVSVNPPASHGTLQVGQINLAKYAPYVADYFLGEVAEGKLDVTAAYRFGLATKGIDLVVTNALARLSNLKITAGTNQESIFTLPSLAVENAEADLIQRTAKIGTVRTSGASALVRRLKNGNLNWLSLLKLPPAKPAATNSAAWRLSLGELMTENWSVTIEDKVPANPAALKLERLAFGVRGFDSASNSPVALTLDMNVGDVGKVSIVGTTRLSPLSARADLTVVDVDVRAAQPYLDDFVKLVIRNGRASTKGRAEFSLSPQGTPQLTFAGNAAVSQFAAVDGVELNDFVKWDSLAIDGIDFKLAPQNIAVQEVRLNGLKTSVVMGADKRLNIERVLNLPPRGTNQAAARPVAKTPAGPATPTVPVQLASLVLQKGSLQFSDQSISPNCNFGVQEFEVRVKGLSTIGRQPAEIAVSGRVDDLAPFSVTGRLKPQPDDLLVDLVISNRNTDLTPFTPYLEKYGGHSLQKGKLSVGLRYEIKGKELKAGHQVLVDQLTLGPRNSSPDATKLPVKLAVALLKDRNGKIELDLPVSGRLDDPQFRVFPVVMQVFMNLLTKAVTSPFALLGKLVGGGEELSTITFAPGSSELAAAEGEKLNKLARALAERPNLSLEIAGSTEPANDRRALMAAKFDLQLRSIRLREIMAAGAPPPLLADIKLDNAERERLLVLAYIEAFGPLPTNAPPTSAKSSTPPANSALPAATPAAADASPKTPAPAPARPRTSTQSFSAAPPPAGKTSNATVATKPPSNAPASPATATNQSRKLNYRPYFKGSELMTRKPAGPAPSSPKTVTPPATPPTTAASAAPGVSEKPNSASPPIVVAATPPTKPTADLAAAPVAPPAIPLAEMAAQLLERIATTENDLRELMQQRAQRVQAHLVQSGHVAPDRLFIRAPRPVDANFKGDTKVEMLLQ